MGRRSGKAVNIELILVCRMERKKSPGLCQREGIEKDQPTVLLSTASAEPCLGEDVADDTWR